MRKSRDSGTRPMDDLSIAFEGSRKAVNAAIDKICEFTGNLNLYSYFIACQVTTTFSRALG